MGEKKQIDEGSKMVIDGTPNREQRGVKMFTKGEKMIMYVFGHNGHQPQI